MATIAGRGSAVPGCKARGKTSGGELTKAVISIGGSLLRNLAKPLGLLGWGLAILIEGHIPTTLLDSADLFEGAVDASDSAQTHKRDMPGEEDRGIRR